MITIGLGEYVITNDENETIITHALGTCVAIIMHCPHSKLTGMAHIVLANRPKDIHLREVRPAYYVDDFLPKMLLHFKHSAHCRVKDIECTLIGGAVSKRKNDLFRIGEKNVETARSILDGYGVHYDDDETHGRVSRTVSIDIATGKVSIKKQMMII